MGSPLIIPRFFWVTPAGTPAVGYQVFSYVAGTSTPTPTYPTVTDANAGTNPNSNPVVLDSIGSANIFLAPGISYKIILEDPLNNVIWTEDNLNQGGVSGFQSGVQVTSSAGINAVTASTTVLGISAQSPSVTNDANSEFSTTTGRFTPKAAGVYCIWATLSYITTGATITGGSEPQLTIQKNTGGGSNQFQVTSPAPWSTGSKITTWSAQMNFALNGSTDYLQASTIVAFSAGTPSFTYSVTIQRLY